jgi:pimeloyl-ACP methyl ester carboxylesterase
MKKISLLIITVIITIASSFAADNFRFSLPDVAEYKDVSIRFITAKDNIKLAYREAGSPASPIGLIFIPGSTMYGYYYIPLINELSKKNCLVRVIDIRGHGDSEGARGDVQSENDLIEDLSLHIKDLALKNPHMKIIIGGHSMGGGICGRYLEHYGYESVKGVVYVAPFFHYKQPGMKNPGYVDVNIISFIFGGDHSVLQVYHPNSGDPKLVREYTNIMSKASMVSDFSSFRKNHNTPAVYVIGKDDELR